MDAAVHPHGHRGPRSPRGCGRRGGWGKFLCPTPPNCRLKVHITFPIISGYRSCPGWRADPAQARPGLYGKRRAQGHRCPGSLEGPQGHQTRLLPAHPPRKTGSSHPSTDSKPLPQPMAHCGCGPAAPPRLPGTLLSGPRSRLGHLLPSVTPTPLCGRGPGALPCPSQPSLSLPTTPTLSDLPRPPQNPRHSPTPPTTLPTTPDPP